MIQVKQEQEVIDQKEQIVDDEQNEEQNQQEPTREEQEQKHHNKFEQLERSLILRNDESHEPERNFEYESTISIKITEDEFLKFQQQYHDSYCTDLILIFDSGLRISNLTYQLKHTFEKQFIVGSYCSNLYPIVRTKSVEKLQSISPTTLFIPEKTITRFIYKEIIYKNNTNKKNDHLSYKLRYSIDYEVSKYGSKYILHCEIEYPPKSHYLNIRKYEDVLMKFLFKQNIKNISYDELTLSDIFSCVIPKIQLWNCFDDKEPYQWAYKHNGIKAKLYISNDTVYIWPDTQEITTVTSIDKYLKSVLSNLCIQIEILEEYIVIVEIIAFRYDDNIFYTEPLTNIIILDYLNELLEGKSVFLNQKPVKIQKYFSTQLPVQYDKKFYDGFVIAQNDMLIKWKIPTIDVQCLGGNDYIVANKTIKLEEYGIKNAIYEIMPDGTVLRLRTDRLMCSGENEFDVFVKSIKLLTMTENDERNILKDFLN